MNKLLLPLLLATAIIVSLANCKKDFANTPAWQASINGNPTSGNYFGCTYTSSNHTLAFTFYNSQAYYYPLITMSSPVSDTGNYYMNGFASGQYDLRADVSYQTYAGGDGVLRITKFDLPNKKVSGTFSFTAPLVKGAAANKNVTITDGVFNDLDIQVY